MTMNENQFEENSAGSDNHQQTTVIQKYFNGWRHAFDCSGKASRSEYWTFLLVNIIIASSLVGILSMLASSSVIDSSTASSATIAVQIIFGIPALTITIRRLLDTGLSEGIVFLLVIVCCLSILTLSKLEGKEAIAGVLSLLTVILPGVFPSRKS